MKWLLDKVGGAFVGQALRILLSVILPILAPLAVAVAGIFQNVEWYLWISAAILSFWFCLSSINQFSQISSRMSSKWKLSQTGINIINIVSDVDGKKSWSQIQLEILLFNRSEFPIEYEFEPITARISDRVNVSAEYINRGGIIDPGTGSTFTTEAVSVGEIASGSNLAGEWSFIIKYGRPGAMRHRSLRRCHIAGHVNAERMPENVRWYFLPANEIKLLK